MVYNLFFYIAGFGFVEELILSSFYLPSYLDGLTHLIFKAYEVGAIRGEEGDA